VTVGADAVAMVRAPALLVAAMDVRADELGVSAAEAWRRAARTWLGWVEVPVSPAR